MKLIDLKISEYLDILLSGAFMADGSSVSGLAGAQASALVYMTADRMLEGETERERRAALEEAKKTAESLYMEIAGSIEEEAGKNRLYIMEAALKGLKAAEAVSRAGDLRGKADMGTAAANFEAALRGGWMDILRLRKDEEKIKNYISRGEKLFSEGRKTAEAIYKEAEKALKKEG